MAVLNRSTLGALQVGFNQIFYQNLVDPDDISALQGLAMIVESRNSIEQYNWMVRLGKVREWIGARVLNRFIAYGYTVRNRKWEDSVEVDVDDFNDDQLGQYVPQIQTMAFEMSNHYVRLLTAILEAGFTELAYDGQFFFDTDHPVGYPNISTVSNMTTERIISRDGSALFTAEDNLVNLRDERGDPLGISYDTLYVARSKRRIVRTLLNTEMFIHPGDTSIDVNEVMDFVDNVVYLNYMTDPEKWFLVDTSKPVKPLILQIRERAKMSSVTDPDDHFVFNTDKFLFGIKARHNAGYSLWQLAYGSTGAINPV